MKRFFETVWGIICCIIAIALPVLFCVVLYQSRNIDMDLNYDITCFKPINSLIGLCAKFMIKEDKYFFIFCGIGILAALTELFVTKPMRLLFSKLPFGKTYDFLDIDERGVLKRIIAQIIPAILVAVYLLTYFFIDEIKHDTSFLIKYVSPVVVLLFAITTLILIAREYKKSGIYTVLKTPLILVENVCCSFSVILVGLSSLALVIGCILAVIAIISMICIGLMGRSN